MIGAIAFIKSGKSSKDSRRWFVKVQVTDNLFNGTVEFSGVAHDTNTVVTNIAKQFRIGSMEKMHDELEKKSISFEFIDKIDIT